MLQVSLKVLVGGNAGKEIPVPVSRFLIGRSDECHLRPKSDAISRNHCAILVHDEEVAIRDLNSRNGTFLNEEKVKGDVTVQSGDKLRIGRLEFEFVVHSTKKKAAPIPEPDTKDKKPADSGSMEFDVTEWLEEVNSKDKSVRKSDPDTRQFKLDETDRIALEAAGGNGSDQPASTGDSGVKGDSDVRGDSAVRGDSGVKKPASKKTPGKLPERPKQAAANSREAAADMLKKFFNNR